jgi:choline dehydrogenase-like flavoprotein
MTSCWRRRQYGHTAYHVVGTCKMGHDPMAVATDELRVHGLVSLRVIDASIMPTITSGKTNAPEPEIITWRRPLVSPRALPV